jgi:hypothetical protein
VVEGGLGTANPPCQQGKPVRIEPFASERRHQGAQARSGEARIAIRGIVRARNPGCPQRRDQP